MSHEIQNHLDINQPIIGCYRVLSGLQHPVESLAAPSVQVRGPLQGVPGALLGVLDLYELSAHEADSFPVVVLAIVVIEWLQHLQDPALADFDLL
ncbi:hypothetical protein TIFTF001_042505 [Ficus carica]|uniref:Uncharacterized protein n=1 Tax=Ficus carica TaxID=3494 RepID=A0AA88CYK4_FICCA|nr:hypothetical protein TIFTF001_042505 [Ficus carica]